MALLQKIFSSRRTQNNYGRGDNGRRPESSQKTISPKLDKSKIRLVIYADSDRGRVPFFDTDAIKLVEDTNKTQNVLKSTSRGGWSINQRENAGTQAKPPPKYHFSRLGSDVKVLEEMMFGNVALAFKGSTLKVHVLRSPNKLMLTKVFFPEKPREEIMTSDSGSESMSLPSSCNELSSDEFTHPLRKHEGQARSIPVDVPSKDLMSDCSTDDDSLTSFTSSGSLRASFPSPSNNSLSSHNSLHKRWMRAQTTSFDCMNKKMAYDPEACIDGSGKRKRRQKLAVAILFGSYEDDEENYRLFRSFIFSHFALIEGHLQKLCRAIEKAYFNTKVAIPVTMEALDQFKNSVYDLYMAPRLSEPVWLTMMSTTTYKYRLCEKFMKEFNNLVEKFDNRSHNFFISTLLSAVLTQHLAWVATVSPADGPPTKTYLDKHTAKWIDTLAKTHPYNPLWAQLGDLYGAIGQPLKISRTLVTGKKAEPVKRLLYFLSYFIRCSDMQEGSCGQNLSELISTSSHLEESLSPTPSEKTIVDNSYPDDFFTSPSRQESVASSGGDISIHPGVSEVTFKSHPHSEQKKLGMASVLAKSHSSNEGKNIVAVLESKFETNVSLTNSGNVQEEKIHLSSDENKTPNSLKLNFTHVGSDMLNESVNDEYLGNNQSATNSIPSTQSSLNGRDLHSKEFDSISLLSCDSSSYVFTSRSDSMHGFSELHTDYPISVPSCSLTPLPVCESPVVENVHHVNKATVCDQSSDNVLLGNPPEEIRRCHSFSDGKVKSRLTQQLAASDTSTSHSKTTDVRRMFLSEGSSSMFDEYYESGIEVKTIDAVSDSDLVSPNSQVKLGGSDNAKSSTEGDVKKSFSRQSSIQDARYHHGRPVPSSLPKKSEISRRRHVSSTSSIDYDAFDPITQCKEIKFPDLILDNTIWNIRSFDRNFGRSLLASYTDHYMPDFVLHGTSDKNFKSRLLHDLQMTVQHSILDEPIDEAVCVIADTDNWTVEVASSKVMSISPSGSTTWMPSKLVADLIESVVEISKFKMGPEFCLMTIEDRLQEIYFKSIILSEYLNGSLPTNQQELASTLGFDRSDMPLLLAVAGTHTPSLARGK